MFGDGGDGALGRGLAEILGQKAAHGGVTRTAAAAAHHHADQEAIAAPHRGDEIEAGGAGVAGLDPVHPLDVTEQMVVAVDRTAAEDKGFGREVTIITREAILDGTAERRLIARGSDLRVVGQPRGIVIDRSRHAERARLARHHPGEIVFAAAEGFGNHDRGVVGRARHDPLDGVFDPDGLARAQIEFGGILFGSMFGYRHFGIELDLVGLEALEQQIERHHLGQRGRMAQRVGIVGGKRRAGIAVDDDRGGRRVVAFPRFIVARVMAMPVVAARLGTVRGENDRRGNRDQPEYVCSLYPRGSQDCAKHELPRPSFCRDHRFVRPNYARRPVAFPRGRRFRTRPVVRPSSSLGSSFR